MVTTFVVAHTVRPVVPTACSQSRARKAIFHLFPPPIVDRENQAKFGAKSTQSIVVIIKDAPLHRRRWNGGGPGSGIHNTDFTTVVVCGPAAYPPHHARTTPAARGATSSSICSGVLMQRIAAHGRLWSTGRHAHPPTARAYCCQFKNAPAAATPQDCDRDCDRLRLTVEWFAPIKKCPLV